MGTIMMFLQDGKRQACGVTGACKNECTGGDLEQAVGIVCGPPAVLGAVSAERASLLLQAASVSSAWCAHPPPPLPHRCFPPIVR